MAGGIDLSGLNAASLAAQQASLNAAVTQLNSTTVNTMVNSEQSVESSEVNQVAKNTTMQLNADQSLSMVGPTGVGNVGSLDAAMTSKTENFNR